MVSVLAPSAMRTDVTCHGTPLAARAGNPLPSAPRNADPPVLRIASFSDLWDLSVRQQNSALNCEVADGLPVVGIQLRHHIRMVVLKRVDFGKIVRVNKQQPHRGAERNRANHQKAKTPAGRTTFRREPAPFSDRSCPCGMHSFYRNASARRGITHVRNAPVYTTRQSPTRNARRSRKNSKEELAGLLQEGKRMEGSTQNKHNYADAASAASVDAYAGKNWLTLVIPSSAFACVLSPTSASFRLLFCARHVSAHQRTQSA